MSEFNRFFLSLGSNIQPEINLPRAVSELAAYGQILAVSSVWESAPVGLEDQPNFLNAALLLGAEMSAESFQETAIPAVEAALGRVRSGHKFGPRTIDIDIMLVNEETLSLGHRSIPSPEILERAFVAIPLAEIEPDYRHPLTGQRLDEIVAGFGTEIKRLKRRKDVVLVFNPQQGLRKNAP